MRVIDYILPKSVDSRVRMMLDEIRQILNEGEYEAKVVAAVPGVGDPGTEGEIRFVITGATVRQFVYLSGNWWYSNVFTKLT